MVVYVEVVLLSNLAINALVIYLALISARQRVVWWRVLLGATLGAALALTLPYVDKGVVAFKLSSVVAMSVVIADFKRLKHYFCTLLLFLFYTFSLGGITVGMSGLFSGGAFSGANGLLPFWISFSALVLLIAVRRGILAILSARSISKNCFRVEVSIRNKVYRVDAYYDTGNKLYEPTTLAPVVMLSPKAFGGINANKNIRVSTVSGSETLSAARLDYVKIYEGGKIKKIENIFGALAKKDFNGYQMLLHSDMI